jgi:hypothetical protein
LVGELDRRSVVGRTLSMCGWYAHRSGAPEQQTPIAFSDSSSHAIRNASSNIFILYFVYSAGNKRALKLFWMYC